MKKATKRQASPKTAKLSTGEQVELDGDLVFLIDALYREIALEQELGHTYGDIKQEIESVYQQMDSRTRKEYFLASVFLNYVTYENEMLERVSNAIERRARARSRKRG